MDMDMALSFFLRALKEAAEGSHRELKDFAQCKEIPGRKGKTKVLVRCQILATVANVGIFLEEEKENETQKYGPKRQRKLMSSFGRDCGVSSLGRQHGGYERSLHC